MAATVTWAEKIGLSGEHGDTSDAVEVPYTGSGSGTYDEAREALASTVPATLNGRVLKSIRVEERGGGQFEGSARYASDAMTGGGVGTALLSFSTSGGTRHITQARPGTTSTGYASTGAAPDVKGAIGAPDGGVPAGCDITFPQFNFRVTHYFSDDQVTDAFIGKIHALTGCTNSAPFRGLAAGECLFLGAEGSKRSGGDWEITFSFAGSPNRTNVSIGGITVTSVKGWQYLDVRYAFKESANVTVQQPLHIYVHTVYGEGDFSQLGISTTTATST